MPASGFLQLVFVECRCVGCCVCGGGGGGVFGSVILGLGFQDRLGPSPGNTEQQPRLTYSKFMLLKSMHLSYILKLYTGRCWYKFKIRESTALGKYLSFLEASIAFEGMGRPRGSRGSEKHIWKIFHQGDPEIGIPGTPRGSHGTKIFC